MIEMIRSLLSRLFLRAQVEILEEVDDILSDFNDYIDRLQASAQGHLEQADEYTQMAAQLNEEADTHLAQAKRAENVAANIKKIVG